MDDTFLNRVRITYEQLKKFKRYLDEDISDFFTDEMKLRLFVAVTFEAIKQVLSEED